MTLETWQVMLFFVIFLFALYWTYCRGAMVGTNYIIQQLMMNKVIVRDANTGKFFPYPKSQHIQDINSQINFLLYYKQFLLFQSIANGDMEAVTVTTSNDEKDDQLNESNDQKN